MPKIYTRPLARTHIRLFEDDWETLKAMFGRSEICPTEVVRNIISAAVSHMRSHSDKAIDHELEELGSLEELAKELDLNLIANSELIEGNL